MEKGKISEWWVRFILLTGSTIISLLIIEGFLQIQYRRGYAVLPYGLRGDNVNENFYIGCVPNFTGISRQTGTEYQTNSLGFRDDPVDLSSEHVIFLGDSTTFGLNIQHEETYPEQVEQYLRQQGYAIQSINTATPGQGTISQLRILDELLHKSYLKPRVIILGFFANDFSNNMWFEHYLDQRQGILELTRSSMQALRREGVEETIVKALKTLKNQKFSHNEFWNAVEKCIGKTALEKYREQLFRNAGGVSNLANRSEETEDIYPIVTQRFKFKIRVWLYIKAFIEILRGEYAPQTAEAQEENEKKTREDYQKNGAINERGEFSPRPGREVEWDWLSPEDLLNNRSYQITLKALHEIIKFCHERGISFILVYLPAGEEEILSGDTPLYNTTFMEEFHAIHNVFYINILENYQSFLKEKGLTSLPSGFYSTAKDAGHPGPLACKIISNALSPVIIQVLEKSGGIQ